MVMLSRVFIIRKFCEYRCRFVISNFGKEIIDISDVSLMMVMYLLMRVGKVMWKVCGMMINCIVFRWFNVSVCFVLCCLCVIDCRLL